MSHRGPWALIAFGSFSCVMPERTCCLFTAGGNGVPSNGGTDGQGTGADDPGGFKGTKTKGTGGQRHGGQRPTCKIEGVGAAIAHHETTISRWRNVLPQSPAGGMSRHKSPLACFHGLAVPAHRAHAVAYMALKKKKKKKTRGRSRYPTPTVPVCPHNV